MSFEENLGITFQHIRGFLQDCFYPILSWKSKESEERRDSPWLRIKPRSNLSNPTRPSQGYITKLGITNTNEMDFYSVTSIQIFVIYIPTLKKERRGGCQKDKYTPLS